MIISGWSKRTQDQFMSGEWFLVAPVYEDSPIRNDIYLPAGKWIDCWDGAEHNGPTVLNSCAAPLDKLPLFVKAGAIIPMCPEMLHDRDRPKNPVTIDVYPFGTTSFSLYEDDGVTQEYRTGAFARTMIDVDAPKSLDTPGGQISVRVGPAKGRDDGMPASRSYVVDLHVPAKPVMVKLGDRTLPEITMTGTDRAAREQLRLDFAAASEGWSFDATDRRGVVHIKIKPQALLAGFAVEVGI